MVNKITVESLTRTFREYLTEKEMSVESSFGVIKRGSGLNVNYVMVDTVALREYCEDLADNYKINGEDPNINKKALIDNKIVVSAVKIAENTEEMKAEYGTCMDASHVKVSAVNKNMSGKGYGRMLYKIVMSEHPEGLTPDRDFVSGTAFKAWQKMAPELTTKKVGGSDKFDNVRDPKTPPKEDDCVLHTRDNFADMSVLDKAYIYSGENTAAFLSKAEATLEKCEQIFEGMWTVDSLADIIVDAGMMLYDLSIGIESLDEQKINIANALNELLNKYKDRYWVFFDTETTGLSKEKEQILEVAAIIVDPEYLTKDVEPIETFHSKARLTRRLKTRLKHPLVNPLPAGQLSTTDVLKMTKYGMPKKRKGADPYAAVYGSIPMEDAPVVLKKFKGFLEKRNSEKPILLIAHNAKFDVEMTNQKLKEYGVPEMQFESLDTLVLIRGFFGPLLKIAAKMEETDPNRKQELVDLFKTLNLKAYDKARERGDISSRLGHLVQALNIKDKGWHSAIADVKMLMEVMKEVVKIIRDNPSVEKDVSDKKPFKKKEPESLEEAKLSKIWKNRAKARAKRQERQYDKNDLKWAHKRQSDMHKNHPELEEEYLKQLEHAQGLVNSTKEYLNKLKTIRKQKLEAKKNSVGAVKFGPETPEKAKGSISVPMKPEYGGVRKGLEKNIAKLKKKTKGAVGIPMGASFGSLEEEIIEALLEELSED